MDTINQSINDTTEVLTKHFFTQELNMWMIIAILEMVIIIILLFSRKTRNSLQKDNKSKVTSVDDINFKNLINSSFNAEKLYKKLLIECHPDRFAPNEERMAIANELSSLITKNRHDINCLETLRDEAIKKLNINL